MFSLMLIGCILSALGTGLGVSYFFLRSGGVVEKVASTREKRLEDLQTAYLDLFRAVSRSESEIEKTQQMVKDLNASVNSRIGAFESRYGKMNKREEERALQEAFFNQMAK